MAGRRIIWSPKAKSNLLAILDYYYQRNGNKVYSNRLNTSIKASIKLLSKYPYLGVPTDIHDIRNMILGDYYIFYAIKEKIIELLTIWDSRQDPSKLEV